MIKEHMSVKEIRDAYFSATLRTKEINYEDKGFSLFEHEDGIRLSQYGVKVDDFTMFAGMEAIRNSCQCWLIKNGDFGTLGITTEAQNV